MGCRTAGWVDTEVNTAAAATAATAAAVTCRRAKSVGGGEGNLSGYGLAVYRSQVFFSWVVTVVLRRSWRLGHSRACHGVHPGGGWFCTAQTRKKESQTGGRQLCYTFNFYFQALMVVSGRSQTGLLVIAFATAWRAMLLLSITAVTAIVLLTLPVVNSSIEQACRTSRKNLAGAAFCQQREMEREEEESFLRLAFEVPWGEYDWY
ncbi:unnamed protein product [Laminaria digitata]